MEHVSLQDWVPEQSPAELFYTVPLLANLNYVL